MIGLISENTLRHGARNPKCVQFGLFQPVYRGTDGGPVVAMGANGSVTHYSPMNPNALERGMIPYDRGEPAPAPHEPLHLAVLSPDTRGLKCLCGPWDVVAEYCCGGVFPELCTYIEKHHPEGFQLARFLTVDVDRYVQHATGGGGFDFEMHSAELEQFAVLRDQLRAAHPDWVEIDAIAKPPGPRGIDPTLN